MVASWGVPGHVSDTAASSSRSDTGGAGREPELEDCRCHRWCESCDVIGVWKQAVDFHVVIGLVFELYVVLVASCMLRILATRRALEKSLRRKFVILGVVPFLHTYS